MTAGRVGDLLSAHGPSALPAFQLARQLGKRVAVPLLYQARHCVLSSRFGRMSLVSVIVAAAVAAFARAALVFLR